MERPRRRLARRRRPPIGPSAYPNQADGDPSPPEGDPNRTGKISKSGGRKSKSRQPTKVNYCNRLARYLPASPGDSRRVHDSAKGGALLPVAAETGSSPIAATIIPISDKRKELSLRAKRSQSALRFDRRVIARSLCAQWRPRFDPHATRSSRSLRRRLLA